MSDDESDEDDDVFLDLYERFDISDNVSIPGKNFILVINSGFINSSFVIPWQSENRLLLTCLGGV
jgi:hypothetical protein